MNLKVKIAEQNFAQLKCNEQILRELRDIKESVHKIERHVERLDERVNRLENKTRPTTGYLSFEDIATLVLTFGVIYAVLK